MDLETRARSAAQGIRRAVDVMETSVETREPRKVERFDRYRSRKNRNRRTGALAVAAALVAVLALVAVSVLRPTGSEVAVSSNVPPGGFIVHIDTGAITPLPAPIATQGREFAVSFLGSWIAYIDATSRLHLANLDGSNDRIISPPGYDASGAQWSPDGSQLAYQLQPTGTGYLGNLYIYKALTGETRRITNFDNRRQWSSGFVFPNFTSGGPYGGGGTDVWYQLPRGNPKHPTWDLWSVPVAGGKPTRQLRNAGWGACCKAYGPFAFMSPIDPRSFTGDALWLQGRRYALAQGPGLAWPRWSNDGVHIAYVKQGVVFVADINTGVVRQVALGGSVNWATSEALVVGPNT
jgi:WD40 repeat protein